MSVHTFSCFTHEQVKEINKKIKKNILQKEGAYGPSNNVSKVGDFFVIPCHPLMELVHPWLYRCQQKNSKVFGYDIYWNFHLDTMNFNVYGKEGEYGWHVDITDKTVTCSDMKLTCLLNLSEEPYEGGEFYITTSNEKIEFTSGMGLVMTSLIAHKITPVTKGERITLTYFATGPSWR
jgi:predicted 2-oxoglutarate/Fe(II)-dependent dioxygenase YbiX